MICINNQWIQNGTHIEMLESKDKSEPLLLNGGVKSLMFLHFRENSKRDVQHQSDLTGEVQLPHLCHLHQQQAKTEMKNQDFRTI